MRDFMHGTSAKVLLAVVFVMLALMLFTATQGGSVVANALGLVATPMQRVSTIITNNAAVAAEPLTYSKEELLEENAALKKEIEELQAKLVNYDQYRIENAQLRKYLELKDENRDFKPVPAAVIGRDPNVLYKFTIDKGTNDGISKNDPVITDAGVVGFISAVNANYSQVTTLLSPDTKIAALVTTEEESGTPVKDSVGALPSIDETEPTLAPGQRRGEHRYQAGRRRAGQVGLPGGGYPGKSGRHWSPPAGWRRLSERPCHRRGGFRAERGV